MAVGAVCGGAVVSGGGGAGAPVASGAGFAAAETSRHYGCGASGGFVLCAGDAGAVGAAGAQRGIVRLVSAACVGGVVRVCVGCGDAAMAGCSAGAAAGATGCVDGVGPGGRGDDGYGYGSLPVAAGICIGHGARRDAGESC